MPAPGNLSFEDAGGASGFADRWSVRGRSSADRLAAFGPAATVGPMPDPNALDAAAWVALNGEANVTDDATADPDGGTTADLLSDTTTPDYHAIEHDAVALADEGSFGLAAFLKFGDEVHGGLAFGLDTADEAFAVFDLTDGFVVTTSRSGSISKVSAAIFDVGDGWFLCELHVATSAAIAAIKPAVLLANLAGDLVYAGSGGGIVYVWGVALFDDPRSTHEGFEAWSVHDVALVVGVDAVPATFETSFVDPEGFEAFESAWSNYPHQTTLSSAASLSFDEDGTPENFEDFEELWGTTLATTLSGQVAASFDEDGTPENFEDFEDGWLASPFATTLSGQVAAVWSGDFAFAAESFEEVYPDRVYTVDPGTDVFTSVAHGYVATTQLFVVQPDGGNLPTGLNPTVRYWPVTITTNTFQLSLASGGVAVNVTDAGVGIQSIRSDPAMHWNGPSINETLG